MAKDYFYHVNLSNDWADLTKVTQDQRDLNTIDLKEVADFYDHVLKLINDFKTNKSEHYSPFYFDNSASMHALKMLEKSADLRLLNSLILLSKQEWESGLARQIEACARKYISNYKGASSD